MSKPTRLIVIALAVGAVVIGAVAVALLLLGDKTPKTITVTPPGGAPGLHVETVADKLQNPWDIAFLPDKTMLITERSGAISKIDKGRPQVLLVPKDVEPRGEGGMLGLAVDPKFTDNRFLYACFNTENDVRVARWRLNSDATALDQRRDIITGIPTNPSGRHSGCRIDFGSDGNLWVGTGDAVVSSTPQDQRSLGGKILRVTRDGQPVSGNLEDGDPRIFSYGHRNTQGLAFFDRPRDGSYGFSAEHGPTRDDEINPLKKGNFGWRPGNGYDESSPMTDRQAFPEAVRAAWSSGDSTIAVSDVVFLRGQQWRDWQDSLAVTSLKAGQLRIMTVAGDSITAEQTLLDGEYGRLRAAVVGPDDALYLSTDQSGSGKILRVTPTR